MAALDCGMIGLSEYPHVLEFFDYLLQGLRS